MHNDFSVAAHWPRGFDELALQGWAEQLRAQLPAPGVSLGLVFMGPRFFPHACPVLELLRVHARIPLLVGCSSGGLIAGTQEVEEDPGLVLGLYHLPAAELQAIRFSQRQVEEATEAAYWHAETGVTPERTNAWLVFADPFHLDAEAWLRSWNAAYPGLPILGGLASGAAADQTTQVFLQGGAYEEGGVAVSVGGQVQLLSVISQGCTPIGETWTITRAHRNLIQEIGNRPAYEVLAETFNRLSLEEQRRSRGNLFVGLAMNEYLDDFQRGDFLIRNLIGADPQSGAIAVGALARAGQTIQFQRRDAATGTEDLACLLRRAKELCAGKPLYGACLCSCNGRGSRLFGQPNHDAGHVQEHLGPFGLAGFFCNGEIGPVGGKNFLHGYTASLALFVGKET